MECLIFFWCYRCLHWHFEFFSVLRSYINGLVTPWYINVAPKHSTLYGRFIALVSNREWNSQNCGCWSADIHLEWRFLWISFLQTPWLTATSYAFVYSFGSIEKVQLKTEVKKEKKSFNPRLQQYLQGQWYHILLHKWFS